MVKYYPSIPDDIREWMLEQHLFFVASAPLAGKHVNVSPKGHPSSTFAVLNANKVAYLDATGSGCETISHIYERGNARVTVMFSSFGMAPRILRLFCTGKVIERSDAAFSATVKGMRDTGMETPLPGKEEEGQIRAGNEGWLKGIRAAIVLDVYKVQTSCGFGVPLLGSKAISPTSTADPNPETHTLGKEGWNDRPTMPRWATKQAQQHGLGAYQRTNNITSLDGLPGLKGARSPVVQWRDNSAAVAMRWTHQWDSVVFGILMALFTLVALSQAGLVEVKLA